MRLWGFTMSLAVSVESDGFRISLLCFAISGEIVISPHNVLPPRYPVISEGRAVSAAVGAVPGRGITDVRGDFSSFSKQTYVFFEGDCLVDETSLHEIEGAEQQFVFSCRRPVFFSEEKVYI